jgi:hypothetical protein
MDRTQVEGGCIICGDSALHGMEYCDECARAMYGPPDWEQTSDDHDPWQVERE